MNTTKQYPGLTVTQLPEIEDASLPDVNDRITEILEFKRVINLHDYKLSMDYILQRQKSHKQEKEINESMSEYLSKEYDEDFANMTKKYFKSFLILSEIVLITGMIVYRDLNKDETSDVFGSDALEIKLNEWSSYLSHTNTPLLWGIY